MALGNYNKLKHALAERLCRVKSIEAL